MDVETELLEEKQTQEIQSAAVKPSIVQVYFPARERNLSYYNDRFFLEPGDFVFVEGKLAGLRGYVTDVTYNFKIHLSDYKKVIGKADTHVRGTFSMGGAHYLTFDPKVLPRQQAVTWFRPPDSGDTVTGTDDMIIPLSTLEGLEITPEIADRGHDYYLKNRVRYLSLLGTDGYALVEGTRCYEVTFTYEDGMISHLSCDCFCSYHCKHEFAVLLQLKYLLHVIEEKYGAEFDRSGCFAAIDRVAFQRIVLNAQETGTLTLED